MVAHVGAVVSGMLLNFCRRLFMGAVEGFFGVIRGRRRLGGREDVQEMLHWLHQKARGRRRCEE